MSQAKPKPWERLQADVRSHGACIVLGHNWIGTTFEGGPGASEHGSATTRELELHAVAWECLRCGARATA